MLHNPISLPPSAWPTLNPQPPSHGASPSQRSRPVRWHPYESGNPTSAGMTGLSEKQDKRRLQITIPRPCIVCSFILICSSFPCSLLFFLIPFVTCHRLCYDSTRSICNPIANRTFRWKLTTGASVLPPPGVCHLPHSDVTLSVTCLVRRLQFGLTRIAFYSWRTHPFCVFIPELIYRRIRLSTFATLVPIGGNLPFSLWACYHYSLFHYFWVGAHSIYLYPYLGPSLPFWDAMLSTTMSYGDLARGLHLQNPLIDFSNLNLSNENYLFDSDYFSYLVDSPENMPSPEMRDIDYFPHRVYVIGGNCTGCILSAADYHCSSCGTGSDSCCGTRLRSTVSVRRHNTHPRSKHPYTRRHASSKMQRTRSLTDINNSNVPTPSPLRQSAVSSVGAGQLCESFESAHLPGTFNHPTQPIHTPSTIKPHVLRSILTTPSTRPSTPSSVTPTTIHPSRILVAPASAISPISPVRERGFFGRPMTHGQSAIGEATSGVAARSYEGSNEGDDDDARTEMGSPEEDMDHVGPGGGGPTSIRLPPIQSLPPMATQPIYPGPTTISQELLLYGPAGVTPAPAELQRNNVHDKLPPVPAFGPSRQATFFGIQNVPVADGTTRFATMCAPGVRPVPSSRPVYPPAGLGDQFNEWKERQRAKERADIVVKDGDLTPVERAEMDKRISASAMSVKVINHIYYGVDDVPKTRSPTTLKRRLDEDEDTVPGPAVSTRAGSSRDTAYWPPTPASMPASPESPRTRRGRQRASLRKEVLGIETAAVPAPAPVTVEREERDQQDPTGITHTYIDVVALAYLAGAKPEIHRELRAAAECQADLAMKIAGSITRAYSRSFARYGLDGGDFTPSPLIDPRRTFLASLVLASKFLLDKAFSNKAWAKLLKLASVNVLWGLLSTGVFGSAVRSLASLAPRHLNNLRPPQQMLSPPYVNDNLSVLSSPPGSQGTTSSTPTLYSDSEPDALQGYEDLGQWTATPEYFDSNEPAVVDHDGDLQRAAMSSDLDARSRAASSAKGVRAMNSSDARVRATMSSNADALPPCSHSRPSLHSIRSFDRPPLRHAVSDMVTPQTDSMGCAHAAPIYVEVGRESPLAYAVLDQPWNAINASHWDFGTDGVVGA
ncbi:Formin-like protein 6 [Rhizoctonia solani]|uniref:Formin-like protein 6 n=1 Tax=Rhizoctonia solani TaxID=456999 RepID=A0A8H8P313_9AGAM|nr:Formin-like protein 6 [Rhizoctonia solani]QRW24245.1 Formin-like protein 6 [Rhizoctonia solani]